MADAHWGAPSYDQGAQGGYQNNGGYQQTQQPEGGYQPPPQQPPPPQQGQQPDWQARVAGAAAAAALGGGGQGALGGMAAQALGAGGVENMAEQKLNQGKTMLAAWFNLDAARFYFEVSNKYVRDKCLLVVLAHGLHFGGPAKFKFPEAYQATTGPRQEPKYDLHAPDLYVPTMAFVTYIILNAFALG